MSIKQAQVYTICLSRSESSFLYHYIRKHKIVNVKGRYLSIKQACECMIKSFISDQLEESTSDTGSLFNYSLPSGDVHD